MIILPHSADEPSLVTRSAVR